MYPALAEKTDNDFVPDVFIQIIKQKPVNLIAQAQTVTATAVMYEVGKGFIMVKPIERKEWWEDFYYQWK